MTHTHTHTHTACRFLSSVRGTGVRSKPGGASIFTAEAFNTFKNSIARDTDPPSSEREREERKKRERVPRNKRRELLIYVEEWMEAAGGENKSPEIEINKFIRLQSRRRRHENNNNTPGRRRERE